MASRKKARKPSKCGMAFPMLKAQHSMNLLMIRFREFILESTTQLHHEQRDRAAEHLSETVIARWESPRS